MQAKEGNSSGVSPNSALETITAVATEVRVLLILRIVQRHRGSFGREENEWSFIVGDPSLNEHHLNCSLVQPAISLVQEVDGLLGF